MSYVRLHEVSFSYTSAVDVLDDVNLDLGPGWAGLVGANGSGKSTLLRLISGSLQPQRGRISVTGVVAECSQSIEEPTPVICSFADSEDTSSFRLRARLNLDPIQVERWSTLSPGERKRWQIGAALDIAPNVLLLDEPTNHLDEAGYDLLVSALRGFNGVGVIVSHDRRFLDEMTTKTIELRRSTTTVWAAPYSEARRQWTSAAAHELRSHQAIKRELRKAERRAADQQRVAEQKRAKRKRDFRQAKAKDHDAHSTARKGKAASGDAAMSRSISVARSKASRLQEQIEAVESDKALGRTVFFNFAPPSRERLMTYEGELTISGRVLIEHCDVELRRSDRIRLAGRNGSGKSTLLGTLVELSDLPPERLLYLPQETNLDANRRMLEQLRTLPSEQMGRVLQVVAALGSDPSRILASDVLSPGESRKLAMAFGMGTHAWCLILDEPTNHLDLPSIERLEEALENYPGALLLVSHDRELAERIARTEWRIEEGSLVESHMLAAARGRASRFNTS